MGTAPTVDLRSLAIAPIPARPVKTLMTPKTPPQPKTKFFIDHVPEELRTKTPTRTPEEEAAYQASVRELLKLFPEDSRNTTTDDW